MSDPVDSSRRGDFIVAVGNGIDHAAVATRLRDIRVWPPLVADEVVQPKVEMPSAQVIVATRGDIITLSRRDGGGVALYNILVTPADMHVKDFHDRLFEEWRSGKMDLSSIRGSFSLAFWDTPRRRLAAFTDFFRTQPLFEATINGCHLVATDLRLLTVDGLVPRRVDLSSIYHFLNFSFVPTPATMFLGVRKLPAASRYDGSGGKSVVSCYWRPQYSEDLTGSDESLAQALAQNISSTVERYLPRNTTGWGTFVSGGTDSTSIAGLFSKLCKKKVHTFSIGFEEPGFDELSFARIAAEHYGFESHTYVVTPEDVLSALPVLTTAYDEPVGNSSAVPTYYCAKLARSKEIDLLVAGDGGDEIFGGNERYSKDRILARYFALPHVVKNIIDTTLTLFQRLDYRPVNRLRNFARRGSLPNPERFFTDDSFASDHFNELLTVGMRALMDQRSSLQVLSHSYEEAGDVAELHKLMFIDLQGAIVDNDLTKVTRSARAAGVSVRFPYLDVDLVQYTGRLPANCKVRGHQKRFLFKQAMRDVLPQAIIAKRKQGFGVPIGIWFRRHSKLRALVEDVVLSSRATERGYFEPAFLRQLIRHHMSGAWDHGPKIWYLLMLELWHRTYVDGA